MSEKLSDLLSSVASQLSISQQEIENVLLKMNEAKVTKLQKLM